jgi:hypothetical protein
MPWISLLGYWAAAGVASKPSAIIAPKPFQLHRVFLHQHHLPHHQCAPFDAINAWEMTLTQ